MLHGTRGLRPLGGVACRRRCESIDSSSRLASDHRSLTRDAVRLLPRAVRLLSEAHGNFTMLTFRIERFYHNSLLHNIRDRKC